MAVLTTRPCSPGRSRVSLQPATPLRLAYSCCVAELLLAGEPFDGRFLLRHRQGAVNDSEFILSLVHGGAVTNHLLKRDGFGHPFSVNGHPTNGRTLTDVVRFLKEPRDFWIVPLTVGLQGPDKRARSRKSSRRGARPLHFAPGRTQNSEAEVRGNNGSLETSAVAWHCNRGVG